MSHVAEMECEINDLEALSDACKELGLELRLGQKTYKWYGRSVGDYPLPEGMTAQDLGKCDHAICIPGNPGAYEIGVIKKKTGESYSLVWDFWAGGFGLVEKVGDQQATKLQDEYLAAVTTRHERRRGRQVRRSLTPQGAILLEVQ
jgi:hypothetical protein